MSSYRALTAVSEVVSQLRRRTLELPTVLILSAVFSRSSLPRPTRMIPAAPAVLHASAVSCSRVLVDYSEGGEQKENKEKKKNIRSNARGQDSQLQVSRPRL